jgi:hypothetical protein
VKVTKPNTKESDAVTQENFIIELFCRVDDMLPKIPEHFQAKLSRSELITLGLLLALKGVSRRAFYRWIEQDWKDMFSRFAGANPAFSPLEDASETNDTVYCRADCFRCH